MDELPLVNGNAYDWVSITLSMLTNPAVAGVTAVMYKDKQVKKNNPGAGKFPVSRGRGAVEYECSIELEEIEVRRILATLPAGKGLKDVPPFTMVVSYLPDGQTTAVTDIISYVEFTGQGVDTKTGDTTITQKLELIIAGIQWGKQPTS